MKTLTWLLRSIILDAKHERIGGTTKTFFGFIQNFQSTVGKNFGV